MKSLVTVGLPDVQAVYRGFERELWELIMGHQIHIGGLKASLDLAERARIPAGAKGIDLCCCNGAGMRALLAGLKAQLPSVWTANQLRAGAWCMCASTANASQTLASTRLFPEAGIEILSGWIDYCARRAANQWQLHGCPRRKGAFPRPDDHQQPSACLW